MTKLPKPIRLYWDSCAWLGLLNGEADKKRELGIIYANAQRGSFELWTSTLSILEARRLESEKEAKKPLSAENLRTIAAVFRQPFVKLIPMALDVSEHARELVRATPGLTKWQDAVHLASALRWDAVMFHTYDKEDLLHLSERFSCRNGRPLPICYPSETADGPLFAKISQA